MPLAYQQAYATAFHYDLVLLPFSRSHTGPRVSTRGPFLYKTLDESLAMCYKGV